MTLDPLDGLVAADVGTWAKEKYEHVAHYANMFARAMKGKWGRRVYLELFSGPGRARLEGSERFIDTASLRVHASDPGFDFSVFGELDGERLAALSTRCSLRRPDARCHFVAGDVNETWPTLAEGIQKEAGEERYLTFCFIDPYRCADLAFATIRGLSKLYLDFLVLIPSYMDAHRNEELYKRDDNTVIDRFLGDRAWRTAWIDRPDKKEPFGEFIADQFGRRMAELKFKYEGVADMKLIRSTEKNLPLYYLAFFSRSDLGLKFWQEAKKSSSPQRSLF